ncbi:MAG: outer membrane lipoprotein chaperone LolA [Succinivibrio sp.]|nr:outer membrane lipoprotein chaperone LolA [Succinivibrio sp.]
MRLVTSLKGVKVALVKAVMVAFLVSVSFQASADTKDELQSKLSTLNALSSTFSQTVTRKDGSLVSKSSGRLSLKKPDKFMLHTTSPDEQVLFTKGNTVYFYDPFVNQVSIFDKQELYSSPFMLLTSKSESVWGQYEVAKDGNSYVLKAKNHGQVVSIKLGFQGDLVSDLYVQLKDGNTNHYTLSQVKTQVSDSSFEYKIPEDAQIDDERKSN